MLMKSISIPNSKIRVRDHGDPHFIIVTLEHTEQYLILAPHPSAVLSLRIDNINKQKIPICSEPSTSETCSANVCDELTGAG